MSSETPYLLKKVWVSGVGENCQLPTGGFVEFGIDVPVCQAKVPPSYIPAKSIESEKLRKYGMEFRIRPEAAGYMGSKGRVPVLFTWNAAGRRCEAVGWRYRAEIDVNGAVRASVWAWQGRGAIPPCPRKVPRGRLLRSTDLTRRMNDSRMRCLGAADAVGPRLLTDLAEAWRAEAEGLRRRYGLEQLASLCEAHAAELEDALTIRAGDVLTLQEAVAVSGYSSSYLRSMMAAGALTNLGEPGAPRYFRRELPRRRTLRPSHIGVEPDFNPEAAATAAIEGLRQKEGGLPDAR